MTHLRDEHRIHSISSGERCGDRQSWRLDFTMDLPDGPQTILEVPAGCSTVQYKRILYIDLVSSPIG